MHVEARTEPIEKIVVHINVGPETPGSSAESLAGYLKTIQAGYHATHDDNSTVVCAADNQVCWGAAYMNQRGLHSCIIGTADQSRAQWLDPFSRAAMKQSASWAAAKARAYGVPVRRLTPDQVKTNGVKGFCGHVDVTAAFGGANAGHYDPGPNFPWDVYLKDVNDALGVRPKPPAEVKVQPQFDPSKKYSFVSILRIDPPDPKAGCWGLQSDWGVITFFGPFAGSMHGSPHVAGRKPARIVRAGAKVPGANPPLNSYPASARYECIAQDGGRYLPK